VQIKYTTKQLGKCNSLKISQIIFKKDETFLGSDQESTQNRLKAATPAHAGKLKVTHSTAGKIPNNLSSLSCLILG
jgi:hypothetical protein